MKRLFTLALLIGLTLIQTLALNPDFAYPQTTLASARITYKSALKSSPHDPNIPLVSSLLQMVGATSAIDRDSLPALLPVIDRATDTSLNPTTKSLLLTVRAQTLQLIYQSDAWHFNQNEQLSDTLPSDISLWTTAQFNNQIALSANRAFSLSLASPLPLSQFSQIIAADSLSLRVFPSLPSFVALKSMNFLQSHSEKLALINQMIQLSHSQSLPWFYWNEQLAANQTSGFLTEITRLFQQNQSAPAAAYLLPSIASHYDAKHAPDWLPGALNCAIKTNPSAPNINALRNAFRLLTLPTVTLSCLNKAAPGSYFELRLSHSHASSFGFKVFSISQKQYDNHSFDPSLVKPLIIKEFKTPLASQKADTAITLSLPKAGYYAIAPLVNGTLSKHRIRYICCTPYVATLLYGYNAADSKSSSAVIVTDFSTGAPLQGAVVTERVADKFFRLGVTDKQGVLRFKPHFADKSSKKPKFYKRDFLVTYKNATFTVLNHYINLNRSQFSPTTTLLFFTDRPLYHPGDTVQWSFIAHTSSASSPKLVTSESFTVKFFNPNRELVDTLLVKTDKFGRASGTFVAPTTGLTGNFFLEASAASKTDAHGSASVKVSDFTMPTFLVDSLRYVATPNPPTRSIQGSALTYAGLPVADAVVEAEIFAAHRARWFSPQIRLGSLKATSLPSGQFAISLPDSLLALSDSPSNSFFAKITVTAPSGEAVHASLPFTTGKPYSIVANIPSNNINTDSPLPNPFSVYDTQGQSVTIPLKWWITPNSTENKDKAPALSGELVSSSSSTLNLAHLPAGEWLLSVAPADPQLADSVTSAAAFTSYSIRRNAVPTTSPLFLPRSSFVADSLGQASIPFGISVPNANVYYAACTADSIQRLSLLPSTYGFHRINVSIPPSAQLLRVHIFTVYKGFTSHAVVQVSRPAPGRLTLTGSSMRNKLSPGSPEEWTLRLTGPDSLPVQGALIATMFNQALAALQPYSFPSAFGLTSPRSTFSLMSTGQNCFFGSVSVSPSYKLLPESHLQFPEFNPSLQSFVSDFSSRKFMSSGSIKIRGTMQTNSFATLGHAEEAKVEEECDEAIAETGDAYDSGHNLTDNFTYRPSEVPQAFWMPNMEFNSAGEALLSFTVPNANTTWSFNAFAWDRRLRSAVIQEQLVAAKPVMVTPNLPSFLRTADTAQISASVYNNSDSVATVSTVIEFFDVSSGSVVESFHSAHTIRPRASAMATASVTAPSNVSSIGFRVRSSSNGFTDGEQSLIPVLSSQIQVFESEQFYLNPGDSLVSVPLPKGQNSSVLEFTSNPSWNIIKLLPQLSTENASTAPAAAQNLFSAAVSSKVLNDNPAIASVIAGWASNPASKALVSRLEQDPSLKLAILSSTPWVQAAHSHSQRLARLSLLLSPSHTSQAIEAAIASLCSLQLPSGAIAWSTFSSNSSMWATRSVLLTLARLELLGSLPPSKSLNSFTQKAIAYCGSQLTATDKVDVEFATIAAAFPKAAVGPQAQTVVNETLAFISANWKKASTAQKAHYALLLFSHGRRAEALAIMESVSQFAVCSPSQGAMFPSVTSIDDYAQILTAFARIMPESPLVSQVLQNLTLLSQSTLSLGSYNPVALVSAFASVGRTWLTQSTPTVSLAFGSHTLHPHSAELATGHFVMALPTSSHASTLSLSRFPSQSPAYGALLTQSSAQTSQIKAHSSAVLSIEKKFSALRNGRWQYVTQLQKGEQSKVVLIVKAKKPIDYLTIVDQRPACLKPVDQLPGWTTSGAVSFYRENRSSQTSLFIDHLPKGTYQITIPVTVALSGTFSSSIASAQSQLAPSLSAHSAGTTITSLE